MLCAGAYVLFAPFAEAGVRLIPGIAGTYANVAETTNTGLSLGRQNSIPGVNVRFNALNSETLLPSAAHPTFTAIGPSRMNEVGQIVGQIGFNTTYRGIASFWDVGTSTAHELSQVNGSVQYNTGNGDGSGTPVLNDHGVIAGSMFRRNASGQLLGEVAVRWDSATAAPVELQGLPLSTGTTLGRTHVVNINNQGTILGVGMETQSGSNALGASVALRWLPGSTVPQRLDDLTSAPNGKRFTRAGDVRADGVTVGFSDVFSGNTVLGRRAVIWDSTSTVATELPSPDGPAGVTQYVSAYAINEAGSISGVVQQGASRFPLRWDGADHQLSSLQTLGTKLDGTTDTPVLRMNATSNAVGYSDFALNGVNVRRAVFWSAGGNAVLDLNTLLGAELTNWTLQTANTITDTGWIGGSAWYDADGAGPQAGGNRAYTLLVPAAGTYGRGDANFDTQVNFADLLLLAQHYGQSNPLLDVHVGDLDLNGAVDFGDLLVLAQHYDRGASIDGLSFSSSFTDDWTLARSLVPEPGSVVVGAMFGVVARRRRVA